MNDAFVLDQIDNTLPNEVARNGPVRVTYALGAGASLQGNLVLIISIPLSITTPWFCFNTTGSIRYFVSVWLASGNLNVQVTGADSQLDGWTGACQGDVQNQLNAGATGGIAGMQQALGLFALFANINAPFHTLYELVPLAVEGGGYGGWVIS